MRPRPEGSSEPNAGSRCGTWSTTDSTFGGSAIAKGRFQPPQRDTGKRLRVNDLIRLSPVRLIDENNVQVGEIDLDEAKRRAREAGLDLVEVSPLSRPPVCRIMDYGKWKYQQKKKEQKAQSHSKHSELKELRLRPKIDTHDLHIKTEKAKDFLADGDKVQFTMIFKGREMAHQEIGLATLRTIRDDLVEISKVEQEPRLMGKRMTMVIAPDRKPKTGGAGGPGAPAANPSAPSGSPVLATAGAPGGSAGGLSSGARPAVAPRPAVAAPRPPAAPVSGTASPAAPASPAPAAQPATQPK